MLQYIPYDSIYTVYTVYPFNNHNMLHSSQNWSGQSTFSSSARSDKLLVHVQQDVVQSNKPTGGAQQGRRAIPRPPPLRCCADSVTFY